MYNLDPNISNQPEEEIIDNFLEDLRKILYKQYNVDETMFENEQLTCCG